MLLFMNTHNVSHYKKYIYIAFEKGSCYVLQLISKRQNEVADHFSQNPVTSLVTFSYCPQNNMSRMILF